MSDNVPAGLSTAATALAAATAAQILRDAAGAAVLLIDDAALAALLAEAIAVREQDTLISGPIRVLELHEAVIVQEQTPDGQALVRRLDSRETADAFVDDRLATYDRMWDGCGCTVRYFA